MKPTLVIAALLLSDWTLAMETNRKYPCSRLTCAEYASREGLPFSVQQTANGAPGESCLSYNDGRIIWVRACADPANCSKNRCAGCRVIDEAQCEANWRIIHSIVNWGCGEHSTKQGAWCQCLRGFKMNKNPRDNKPYGGWDSRYHFNMRNSEGYFCVPDEDYLNSYLTTQCAEEGQSCECDGSILYGAGDSWADFFGNGYALQSEHNGRVECSSGVYGDPLPGVDKKCFCVHKKACDDNAEKKGNSCLCKQGFRTKLNDNGKPFGGWADRYHFNNVGKAGFVCESLTPNPTPAPTNEPSPSPTPTPTPSPTPTPTPSPTPSPTSSPTPAPAPTPYPTLKVIPNPDGCGQYSKKDGNWCRCLPGFKMNINPKTNKPYGGWNARYNWNERKSENMRCVVDEDYLNNSYLTTYCAKEGQSCSCKGTVLYGDLDGPSDMADRVRQKPFVAKAVNGNIKCTNAQFRDPLHGARKHCLCVSGVGEQQIPPDHDVSKCMENNGAGMKPDADCRDCSQPPKQACADGYIMSSLYPPSRRNGRCSDIICTPPAGHYKLGASENREAAKGVNECPSGYSPIETAAECEKAVVALGLVPAKGIVSGRWPHVPPLCSWQWTGKRAHFNMKTTGWVNNDGGYQPLCAKQAEDLSVGKPDQLVKLGGEACSSSKPCEAYHGDCDSDSECAGDLVCVPDKETGRLSGGGQYDYCLSKAEDWRATRTEESEATPPRLEQDVVRRLLGSEDEPFSL